MNIYDFTCDFVRTNHNEYKCSVCGISIFYEGLEKPVLICSKKMNINNPADHGIRVSSLEYTDKKVEEIEEIYQEPPSFMEKVFNFTKAATKHALAGNPKCTNEQINERYNICTQCEFFQNNTCTKCGCALLRQKIYMNKLAWADQSCPVGKWGPVDPINPTE